MHRYLFHMSIAMGRYKDFYEAIGRVNELAGSKGMATMQIWGPVSGAEMNTAILVADYESLADWDAETRRFQTDPEIMKLWREALQHVEGRPRHELWESAFEIA